MSTRADQLHRARRLARIRSRHQRLRDGERELAGVPHRKAAIASVDALDELGELAGPDGPLIDRHRLGGA